MFRNIRPLFATTLGCLAVALAGCQPSPDAQSASAHDGQAREATPTNTILIAGSSFAAANPDLDAEAALDALHDSD